MERVSVLWFDQMVVSVVSVTRALAGGNAAENSPRSRSGY